MSDDSKAKRGRGRPRKLPTDGKGLRLTVSEEEAEVIQKAREALGCSQNDFTRAAVLNFARSVLDAHQKGERLPPV